MKKFNLFFFFLLAFGVLANEGVILDFNLLAPGSDALSSTNIDISRERLNLLGGMDRANVDAEVVNSFDLNINNWELDFGTKSIKTPETLANSFIRVAPVLPESPHFPGENILGVKILFPKLSVASFVDVMPPFTIPALPEFINGEQGGLGVLTNVGEIKQIAVNVYSLNNSNKISLLLQDSQGNFKEYPLGSLNFVGWKKLIWNNPYYKAYNESIKYESSPRSRVYPDTKDEVVFQGIRLYKSRGEEGNVIFYVKDVSVIFDQVVLDSQKAIDDEALWNIDSDTQVSLLADEKQSLAHRALLEENKRNLNAKKEFQPLGEDGEVAETVVTPEQDQEFNEGTTTS